MIDLFERNKIMKNLKIEKNIKKDSIEAIGGKLWSKDGKSLAYFNFIEVWLNFENNAGSYQLDGKKIDGFNGKQLESNIKSGKLWFDFTDNNFKCNIRNTNLLSESEILMMCAKSILSAIEEVTSESFDDEKLVVSEVNLMPNSSLPPIPSIPF